MTVPIEDSQGDKFFPALFGGEEINADFCKILGHSVKHGRLCILDTRLSVESAYIISKAASWGLVDSLLEVTALNCIVHRACVRRASAGAGKERKHVEMTDLDRQ